MRIAGMYCSQSPQGTVWPWSTYNLVSMHKMPPPPIVDASAENALLVDATTAWVRHYNHPDAPKKLVFPLAHTYSTSSIAFENLKGADISKVHLLEYAHQDAEPLFEVRLVLMQKIIKYDHDEDEEEVPDNVLDVSGGDTRPNNVLLSEMWVSRTGPTEEFKLNVDLNRELIGCDKSTEKMFLDALLVGAVYTDYTGNQGTRIDAWYHCAAVVIWPKAVSVYMQLTGDFAHTIKKLADMPTSSTSASNIETVMRIMEAEKPKKIWQIHESWRKESAESKDIRDNHNDLVNANLIRLCQTPDQLRIMLGAISIKHPESDTIGQRSCYQLASKLVLPGWAEACIESMSQLGASFSKITLAEILIEQGQPKLAKKIEKEPHRTFEGNKW